jgi:hypothetical protein
VPASRAPRELADLFARLGEVSRLISQKRAEFQQEITSVTKQLAAARSEFNRVKAEQERLVAQAEEQIQTADRYFAVREAALQTLVHDKITGFDFIARAWADYERALASEQAELLLDKDHPAPKAAELVREKGEALALARRQAKLAEWIVALYEFHFPWLEELRSFDEEQSFVEQPAEVAEGARDDPAKHWVSTAEWTSLTETERNQLALERYLRSRKSPWQLGRDYERYVGYLREQAGCSVTYHGIARGLEDLGRDVLAEKDGVIEVIQCKRWAKHKEIHEKHVFQLFGTMTAARIEHPGKSVTGTFTTTTNLSERARQFARVLGIRVEESFPLSDYPRIKCNVAGRTGEKIYHLPFDQQYDTTVIESGRGESYVMTCAEAESLGFRRAWRWRGQGT